MAKSDQPTTIKKYANRRLYNTGTSTYVTLEDLAAMVKEGEDFLTPRTGDDITRSVLAQIIFEQENKAGQDLLPCSLRQLLIPVLRRQHADGAENISSSPSNTLTREQEIPQAGFTANTFSWNRVRAAGREHVRRNMELFQQTFSMFKPFVPPRMERSAAEPEEFRSRCPKTTTSTICAVR